VFAHFRKLNKGIAAAVEWKREREPHQFDGVPQASQRACRA
jgi:hypothetical protein